MDRDATPPSSGRDRFSARVGIVAAAAALLFLTWQIRTALIVCFAGIVFAVVICSLADPIARRRVPRPIAVLIAVVVIVIAFSVFGWIAMPHAGEQGRSLLSALPTSLGELDRRLGGWLPEDVELSGTLMRNIAARAAAWSGMLLSTLTGFILVVALGTFLAVSPGTYRDGAVRLVPPRRQPALRSALDASGRKLKGWLRAKLATMAIIGTAITFATWLIGLPSPFALGLIAGLLEFIPIIGPIAAAIPALLLALTISPATVVWTALAYFAVQQIESNLVLPLLEGEMVDLPPALLIISFSVVGVLFGIPGIIVTAPLTVALYSLTNDLYVRPLNAGSGHPGA